MAKLEQPTFSLEVPAGWEVRHEEEQVFLISRTPPGVLCCTAQTVENSEELPNLSRMLAGFLTRSGHPVATAFHVVRKADPAPRRRRFSEQLGSARGRVDLHAVVHL